MGLDTTRCVVLNATYEPITIVSSKRALILFLEGKAMIVEEHPELVVRSPNQTFPVPTSIVLKHFVKGRMVFRTKALLTQRNLFIRDQYTCQYCGRNKPQLKHSEFLTRDHVIPRHIGGKDCWENVVACCNSCNNKKAYFMLSDTSMKLLKQPAAPTIFELWTRQQKKLIHN
jgi:5-methylcytosine-specific restriction endonuclease McrA